MISRERIILPLSAAAAATAVGFFVYRVSTLFNEGYPRSANTPAATTEQAEDEAETSAETDAAEAETAAETGETNEAHTGTDTARAHESLAAEANELADRVMAADARPITAEEAAGLERILSLYDPATVTAEDREHASRAELKLISDIIFIVNRAAATLSGGFGEIDPELEKRLGHITKRALSHKSQWVTRFALFGLRKHPGEPGTGVDNLPELHPIVRALRDHPSDSVAFQANLVELPGDGAPGGDR